jgi:hypothetical protein
MGQVGLLRQQPLDPILFGGYMARVFINQVTRKSIMPWLSHFASGGTSGEGEATCLN